jgi:hypothetical protein
MLPASLDRHRVTTRDLASVLKGQVRYLAVKSLWFIGMAGGALVGGAMTFSLPAFLLFIISTALVLLFGHSLGSHRKLVHDSFQCPKWLEYTLVYLGVQVGLAGPLGLLRQHELRDFAQRLPRCHAYLRHGSSPWRDAWWQLNCDLVLDVPPSIRIEPRISQDKSFSGTDLDGATTALGNYLLRLGRLGICMLGCLCTRHRRRFRALANRLLRAQPRRLGPRSSRRGSARSEHPVDLPPHDGRVLAQQSPCISRLGEVRTNL